MKITTNYVKTDLQLFCPRNVCAFFESKNNTITKDGTYSTVHDATPRQMFKCHSGKHRFSETNYSSLFGKHGSFKEYEQTAKLSSYGLSTDAIADVLEKDSRTIATWQEGISKKSNMFHIFICLATTLILSFIQMDELWSFLKNKKKQLWVFIGIDVPTRFWVNFEVGSRTTHTATKLVTSLKRFLREVSVDKPLKITTDKLAAYKNALQNVLSKTPYVYLQIVKQRIHMRLVTVKKCFVKGTSSDFLGKSQNTSFIERFNLTLRQRVSYLHRKTLGYCKNKSNFNTNLWINLFNYNYCREHKSLRLASEKPKSSIFQKCWTHRTPAMAIGLTEKPLTWRFLLVAPIPRDKLLT
jgi:IS1 family transposase/transposase-like protein